MYEIWRYYPGMRTNKTQHPAALWDKYKRRSGNNSVAHLHTHFADMMQFASLLWSALFARGSTLLMQKSKPHLTLKTKRSSDDLLLIQHHTHNHHHCYPTSNYTCHLLIDIDFLISLFQGHFVIFDTMVDQMMHIISHKTNEQQEAGRFW